MRIARLFDGVDPVSGPKFDDDHPRLPPEQARRVLDYLGSGALVVFTTARMDDVLDPAGRAAVPLSFRTDGVWIWSDACRYYLDRHRLAPDAQLLEAVIARDFVMPEVDGETVRRAAVVLREPVADDPVVWTRR